PRHPASRAPAGTRHRTRPYLPRLPMPTRHGPTAPLPRVPHRLSRRSFLPIGAPGASGLPPPRPFPAQAAAPVPPSPQPGPPRLAPPHPPPRPPDRPGPARTPAQSPQRSRRPGAAGPEHRPWGAELRVPPPARPHHGHARGGPLAGGQPGRPRRDPGLQRASPPEADPQRRGAAARLPRGEAAKPRRPARPPPPPPLLRPPPPPLQQARAA